MFLRFRKKTSVADLSEDRVAVIEGKVCGKKEIALPHAGTRCLYFEIMTEVYRVAARGRGRPLWLPEGFDKKCAGFFVDDGTGRAWVRGGDAEALDVTGGTRVSDTTGKKGKRRYTACMIRAGDLVRLRGTVTKPRKDEPDGPVIVPDRKGRIEVLVKHWER